MKKMKLLPSAVLAANLLLCAVCQAQSAFDTTLFKIGNSKLIIGNPKAMTLEYKEPNFKFITESQYYSQNKPTLPQFDTVKVVLLVSDTNNIPTISKGYSVRKIHNSNMESNGDWNCWTCKDYMLHSFYLDDNKKPISPTTIVWQSVSAK